MGKGEGKKGKIEERGKRRKEEGGGGGRNLDIWGWS